MIFRQWVEKLRASGHLVCPTSSAVPVELWGVRPDGLGFHFRCRGVQVRLGVYQPGRARWQVPMWDDLWSPEESLQLWEHRSVDLLRQPDLPMPTRLVFTEPDRPDQVVLFDGSVDSGWRGHDAGLLPVGSAAELFERLSAQVTMSTATAGIAVPAARGSGDRPACPVAAGVL